MNGNDTEISHLFPLQHHKGAGSEGQLILTRLSDQKCRGAQRRVYTEAGKAWVQVLYHPLQSAGLLDSVYLRNRCPEANDCKASLCDPSWSLNIYPGNIHNA
jgi:hypothetical protein